MTIAEKYADEVAKWLRPYRGLYAARGFDADDIAQEGRLALVKQNAYLVEVFQRDGTTGERAAAMKLVLRHVRRRVLGQGAWDAGRPIGVPFWEAVHDRESREHSAHLELELVEAMEDAPDVVAVYLRAVVASAADERAVLVTSPAFKRVRRKAAEYLLQRIAGKIPEGKT